MGHFEVRKVNPTVGGSGCWLGGENVPDVIMITTTPFGPFFVVWVLYRYTKPANVTMS